MKRERGDDDNNLADFHILIVNATLQLNACKAMLYMLPDPNEMSWERAQRLTIADITAIRTLRKTIMDNLGPSDGSSIEEWRAKIATAVDTFCNLPVRCVRMKDPNDEEGFKIIAQDIREMLAGASPADLLKKKQEERNKAKEEEENKAQEQEPEPDTKKIKEENN